MEGTREGCVIKDNDLWPNPVTGDYEKVQDIVTVIGPDEFTFELFMDTESGKESMKKHYRRNK